MELKVNEIKHKRFLILISVMCLLLYYYLNRRTSGLDVQRILETKVTEQVQQIKCYDNTTLNTLEELLPETKIPLNTSIFFVETSCQDSSLEIHPRQACAIESAAKMNPQSNVYLLFPSPIPESKYLQEHVKMLESYDNFKMMHINTKTFFDNTPLESWYKSGGFKSSKWPLSHMSDVLRYTILWKYGGIYLDLDVVVLRSFDGMTNFAGAETLEDINSAVLSFSFKHEIANISIEDLRNNFKGHVWGWNGPGVITRALEKYCRVSKVVDMLDGKCKDFMVFPPSAFYPIHWRKWNDYFTTDEVERDSVMDKIKDSYVIHTWNAMSKNMNISVTLNQPYGVIAREKCPKVYSTLKDFL